MELPHDQTSGRRLPNRKELQGPRPTPLKVKKYSLKTRKLPAAAPTPPTGRLQAPPPRPPLITYDISPKVIHTNPSEFMTLVQRLTGPGSGRTTSPDDGSSMVLGEPGPGPQTLSSVYSDLSPLVNLYNQHNQDRSFNAVWYDQQLPQHQHDDDDGSSAAAFLFPNPMLSPASVEFLSKLLDQ